MPNTAPQFIGISSFVYSEDTDITVTLGQLFTDTDQDILSVVEFEIPQQHPWITYDTASKSFKGKAPGTTVGGSDNQSFEEIQIGVKVTDGTNDPVFGLFTVQINNTVFVNAPPKVLGTGRGDINVQAGFFLGSVQKVSLASYTGSGAIQTFGDVDGDALVLTAKLSNGQDLPAWMKAALTFDPVKGELYLDNVNVPQPEYGKTFSISVTADDAKGSGTATDTFNLKFVQPQNYAPVVKAFDSPLYVQPGSTYQIGLADHFTDPDGDPIAYSVVVNKVASDGTYSAVDLASANWIEFSQLFGKLGFAPAAADVGTYIITVNGIDNVLGYMVTDIFRLNVGVANAGLAPVVTSPIPGKVVEAGSILSFDIKNNFADLDSPNLTYSLASSATGQIEYPVLDWMNITPGGLVVLTPPSNVSDNYSVLVQASDGVNITSQLVNIRVAAPNEVNAAPVLGLDLADISKNYNDAIRYQAGSYFYDKDLLSFKITQIVGGTEIEVPNWLKYDPSNGFITGKAGAAGTFNIKVTATDTAGQSVSDNFNLTVSSAGAPANAAPKLVGAGLADWQFASGAVMNFSVATAFTDSENNLSAYSIKRVVNGVEQAAPAWMQFDPRTGSIFGVAGQGGTYDFKVTAYDAGNLNISDTFRMVVTGGTGANTPPVISATPIGDLSVAPGAAINVNAAAGFQDTDALTYTIKLVVNGAEQTVPGWLTVNQQTGLISGTAGPAGSYTIRVFATDSAPQAISDDFILTVAAGAGATPRVDPEGKDATVTTQEEVAYSFKAADFAFIDADNDALASVIIGGLPGKGKLTLDGKAVTAGQEIAAADLGKLSFVGDKDGFGDAYATFTFSVKDNGGTANGGKDTDATPNTITIKVEDVLDLITGSADPKIKDNLIGTIGKEKFDASKGRDSMTGGGGQDIFVFAKGYGKDRITDFNAKDGMEHDRIDLSGAKAITDFNDLMAHHAKVNKAGDVFIKLGISTLTLVGVTKADLTADDFSFTPLAAAEPHAHPGHATDFDLGL